MTNPYRFWTLIAALIVFILVAFGVQILPYFRELGLGLALVVASMLP